MRNATKYWVIGGEYRDTSFRELVDKAEVVGPFSLYEDARATWTRLAEETRSKACVRYSIATERAA